MRKPMYVFAAVLLLATLTIADETAGKFGIGVKGGITSYMGDVDGSQIGYTFGITANWWLSDYFGLVLEYNKPTISAEKGDDYFKNEMTAMGLMARVKFAPSLAINPYVTAGVLGFDNKPVNKNGNLLPNGANGQYKKQSLAIPFGIGAEYFITELISINVEALYNHTTTDWLDDIKGGDSNDGWLSGTVGLVFNFGEPKDTDHDGIPDKDDADPLHAEDKDGFQDEDGAPDLDNDQDGVLDVQDLAPMDPEDRDGYKDEDGRPDPDNDGDGIEDVKDAAPNEAEDMDGFEDEDGKPDPDNDGDGILDVNDKCPDQPETKNDYEDEDGCPDKKPEIAVQKGQAIVLPGIQFKTGSATLTNSSKTLLDKVVKTLTDNPEIEIEIRGYTDNTGNYEANVKLSKRRAEAVKQYLVENGINDTRIKTAGYGPDNPIAPNNTKDGRAKNRRIEFYRIK